MAIEPVVFTQNVSCQAVDKKGYTTCYRTIGPLILVCVFFPRFVLKGWMWNLIVLISDHCYFIYFAPGMSITEQGISLNEGINNGGFQVKIILLIFRQMPCVI